MEIPTCSPKQHRKSSSRLSSSPTTWLTWAIFSKALPSVEPRISPAPIFPKSSQTFTKSTSSFKNLKLSKNSETLPVILKRVLQLLPICDGIFLINCEMLLESVERTFGIFGEPEVFEKHSGILIWCSQLLGPFYCRRNFWRKWNFHALKFLGENRLCENVSERV